MFDEKQTQLIPKPGSTPVENRVIEIKNLVVSQAPQRELILGELSGFEKALSFYMEQIHGVIWNETRAQLLLGNGGMDITFSPRIHPAASMFFSREDKRKQGYGKDAGKRVWEGEYEPVQFTKRNLIKFLSKFSDYFDPEVKKAIQNLKVSKKRMSESKMISLTSEHEVVTEEYQEETNLPAEFSAQIPLFGGFVAELFFEAAVKPMKDSYGNEKKGRNIIELRCTNAKEAITTIWEGLLKSVPDEIPVYYGALTVHSQKDRW